LHADGHFAATRPIAFFDISRRYAAAACLSCRQRALSAPLISSIAARAMPRLMPRDSAAADTLLLLLDYAATIYAAAAAATRRRLRRVRGKDARSSRYARAIRERHAMCAEAKTR